MVNFEDDENEMMRMMSAIAFKMALHDVNDNFYENTQIEKLKQHNSLVNHYV